MRFRAFVAAYPSLAAAVLYALLASLLLLGAVYEFYRAGVREEQRARETREASLSAARAAQAAATELLATRHAEQLRVLRGKLSASVGEGALLAAIQSLAQSSGVRLEGYRLEERQSATAFSYRLAYVEVEGSYSAIRRFIRGVQQLPAAAVVGNAILEQRGGSNAVAATLELVTFAMAGGQP